MFSHEQFVEYFCQFCDKSFTLAIELKRHERSHTAIRNFACDHCNKAFMDQSTLNDHYVSNIFIISIC